MIKLYHGDCLKHMAELEAESVDAIVTDPPAGISFMSKLWDADKGRRLYADQEIMVYAGGWYIKQEAKTKGRRKRSTV